MSIETIIFDLGGVLIDWSPRHVFKNIIEDEQELDYFLSNVCNPDWFVQQDRGQTTEDGTKELAEKHPKYASYIEMFYERWEEMLIGPIQPTVDILTKLATDKKHRVYALTNWSAETFPVALRKYEFLQLFEGIVVSGHEKVIKPERRIYEIMCERYAIKPETAVFIDDNERNIQACRAFGMQGVHFLSPEQTASELAELGVL